MCCDREPSSRPLAPAQGPSVHRLPQEFKNELDPGIPECQQGSGKATTGPALPSLRPLVTSPGVAGGVKDRLDPAPRFQQGTSGSWPGLLGDRGSVDRAKGQAARGGSSRITQQWAGLCMTASGHLLLTPEPQGQLVTASHCR